ncbi:MAG: hypothetical protein C0507_21210 [Cyanobacteria bacterium PR.3.49]|nr:hypothetical protein [Cyanobacteria bacterium PR.3.49]
MASRQSKTSTLCALLIWLQTSWPSAGFAQTVQRTDIATRNFRSGTSLSKAGKYRESLVQFDEAIRNSPGFADAYVWRGKSLLELDETQKAVIDFNKAMQLDPKNSAAYHMRARAFYELGKYEAALKDYSTAFRMVETSEEKAEMLRLLGRVNSALKRYEPAIANITQSLTYGRNPVAFMIRANLYASLGKHKEASKDYTEAISCATADDLGKLYSLRAISYEKMGRKDLALKDKEKAKQLTKDNWGDLLPDMDK